MKLQSDFEKREMRRKTGHKENMENEQLFCLL